MRKGVHVPTYRSWQMMKNRCLNPKAIDYVYYGSRGISIQPSWLNYDQFLADMGERPSGLTLERLNTDGDYTKLNCIWASRLAQSRNRAYVQPIALGDKTLYAWEWAEQLNLTLHGFHSRLHLYRKGRWPLDKVLKVRHV